MTTLHFREPAELIELLRSLAADTAHLEITQEGAHEIPERLEENHIDLTKPLARFTTLHSLTIKAHILSRLIEHPTLQALKLEGAIAFSELSLPACKTLSLLISGDEHGVACDVERFASLFTNTSLTQLQSLDLRHLDVEVFKKKAPTIVERIKEAPWFAELKTLGLFSSNCITLSQLKKVDFSSQDFVIVSGLLSSFEKNPIKGAKVFFESDSSELALGETHKNILSLPSLKSLKPSLSEDAFEAMSKQLFDADFKIESASVLASMLTPFCKKAQWSRMHTLLKLARKKSRTMRVFLDTLEKLTLVVEKVLQKSNGDHEGQAFLDFLKKKIEL